MKWELNEIQIGDAVRVNMGAYYHYGICTAEDRIVQFGLPQINLNPDEVKVCTTDIATFLCGKFAEVMVLDKKEQKTANNKTTIIEKAENAIGETGYNILHNNCEHFVNRCVFNNNKSSQVEDIEHQMFEILTPKYVFIAPVKMFKDNTVLPKYTTKELKKITNKSLISQKVAAYGLLKYAVEEILRIQDDFANLKKTKTGKPVSKNYNFSISHTPDLIAVALSKCNVGIDLELVDERQDFRLLKKSMLNQDETIEIGNLLDSYNVWTKKEAIYKYKDEKCFNPKQIKIDDVACKTIELEYESEKYVLSVASKNVNNVKIKNLFNKE